MQLVLITPTPPDISAFGVRSLSATLRRQGHETRLIFLPGSIGLLREKGGYVYRYDESILDEIARLCQGADLIGISFMTSYFDRAVQITTTLKKRCNAPVIWGGIHPSTKPEEALEFADMVCIGEGEEALLELLERIGAGRDYHDVEGVWVRRQGEIAKNPLRPLIRDLDSLPHFDFSNSNHYILNKETNRVELLDDELFRRTMPLLNARDGSLKRIYRTMTDRGCPHRCSYCNVSSLKEIYKNDKSPYLRSRSAENVIEELVGITQRFPFVQGIQFFDDTFFARPLNYLKHFAELYKERIGLPFYCQASPNTLTEPKLQALIDAGLVYVEMGIQTGSERIRSIYRRSESNEKILDATKLLHKYIGSLIPPDYHIIIDNPWETDEDILDTVRLLHEVPKPYGLCISSLVFFPGTALYEKAASEGIIKDEVKDIYRKPFYIPPKGIYVNFLIYLFTFQHFPKSVIDFLMRERTVRFFSGMKLSGLFKVLYTMGEACRLVGKGLRAVRKGDWERISLFLRGLKIADPVVAGRKK